MTSLGLDGVGRELRASCAGTLSWAREAAPETHRKLTPIERSARMTDPLAGAG
jgi:hypothetical protein